MLCNLRIKYVPIEVVDGFNLKPDLPFFVLIFYAIYS